jgi:molybdate transport system substrate-binding protein
VSEEQDAAAVGGKVALGEADAGLVYATDVRAFGGRVRAIELPPVSVEITAVIAMVTRTTRRAAAEAFIARVLGEDGRQALLAAGFGTP